MSIEKKLSKYIAYRAIIKHLLRIVGMWPDERSRMWYQLLPFLQLTLNITSVLAIAGYISVHFSDLTRVAKGVSVMSGFLSSIIKTTCMMIHRKDARTLHQTLDLKFSELLKNPRLPLIILDDVTSFQCLCKILSSFTYLSCAVFIMTPLMLMANQQLHQIHPIKYMLVIPAAYPWTIPPNGLLYKFHFVAESASGIFALVVSGGIDCLFTLYIFQIKGQLREMSYRITSKIAHKNVIRECVLQHEVLMHCQEILEKIYGPIILFTMLVNAMNLCSQMFEFSQMMNVSVQRAIFFTIYMVFKLVQTFMYAWAGSQLTQESEKYKAAVYSSYWYSNKHFMTSIVIMLGQRPLILTACKFSVVSIDIFVKVVNTAMSYFFLLQTVHNKQ